MFKKLLWCFTDNESSNNRVTYPDSTDRNRINRNGAGRIPQSGQVLLVNPKDKFHYNVSNGKGKKVIIFNNKNYDDKMGFEPRTGSDMDCDRLIQCFSALGFVPEKYDDATCREIKDAIEKASQLKSSEINCVIVIVMTYGYNNVLFGSDGKYSTNAIMMPFVESQSLAGVPKLLFIQAQPSLETDSGEQVCIIPKFADILWVYSSIEDNISLENEDGYNVFIQTLCDHLNEDICKTYNILQILAMINRRLSISLTSHNNNTTDESSLDYFEVDLPYYKSTLTKLLQLNYLHGTVGISQEDKKNI